MPTPKPNASSQSISTLISPRVSRPRPGMPMSKSRPAPASSSVPPSAQVPLHEDVFGIDACLIDVGVAATMSATLMRCPSSSPSSRMWRPAVRSSSNSLLRDVVLVGLGRGLDRVAQPVDEVLAEVLDHVGGVGELVADQRQREARDLAVEHVLQQAEEAVDAVDDQQQVVERAELAEVEREDVVRDARKPSATTSRRQRAAEARGRPPA